MKNTLQQQLNWAFVYKAHYLRKSKTMNTFLRFYADLWLFSKFQKRKKFSFCCGEHSTPKFGTENSLFALKLVFGRFLRHFLIFLHNASKNVQKRALMQKVSFRFQILILNVHRSKKKTFCFSENLKKVTDRRKTAKMTSLF